MHADSLGFSTAARVVAVEARRLGLLVPGFRSPPRRPGLLRTIRRSGDGIMIAVVVRGRSIEDVVADLVEGVVVANGLRGASARRCRHQLTGALAAAQRAAA
jgi:hypothetical protein